MSPSCQNRERSDEEWNLILCDEVFEKVTPFLNAEQCVMKELKVYLSILFFGSFIIFVGGLREERKMCKRGNYDNLKIRNHVNDRLRNTVTLVKIICQRRKNIWMHLKHQQFLNHHKPVVKYKKIVCCLNIDCDSQNSQNE